jgi:hypothetical protein
MLVMRKYRIRCDYTLPKPLTTAQACAYGVTATQRALYHTARESCGRSLRSGGVVGQKLARPSAESTVSSSPLLETVFPENRRKAEVRTRVASTPLHRRQHVLTVRLPVTP